MLRVRDCVRMDASEAGTKFHDAADGALGDPRAPQSSGEDTAAIDQNNKAAPFQTHKDDEAKPKTSAKRNRPVRPDEVCIDVGQALAKEGSTHTNEDPAASEEPSVLMRPGVAANRFTDMLSNLSLCCRTSFFSRRARVPPRGARRMSKSTSQDAMPPFQLNTPNHLTAKEGSSVGLDLENSPPASCERESAKLCKDSSDEKPSHANSFFSRVCAMARSAREKKGAALKSPAAPGTSDTSIPVCDATGQSNESDGVTRSTATGYLQSLVPSSLTRKVDKTLLPTHQPRIAQSNVEERGVPDENCKAKSAQQIPSMTEIQDQSALPNFTRTLQDMETDTSTSDAPEEIDVSLNEHSTFKDVDEVVDIPQKRN